MGKIKNALQLFCLPINGMAKAKSKNSKKEAGFSYIETIVAMVILTVGLLATLSAMTYSMLYAQVAGKKTMAKEIAGSMVENIFAIRDIQSQGGLAMSGWDAIQIKTQTNDGIFIDGWFPVRDGAGTDGIYGTADDSCAEGGTCTTANVVAGYERKINIDDITESGVVRKKRITVTVRYRSVGGGYLQESISTIIANLPTN